MSTPATSAAPESPSCLMSHCDPDLKAEPQPPCHSVNKRAITAWRWRFSLRLYWKRASPKSLLSLLLFAWQSFHLDDEPLFQTWRGEPVESVPELAVRSL